MDQYLVWYPLALMMAAILRGTLPAERPKNGSSAKIAFFLVFLPHMASSIG